MKQLIKLFGAVFLAFVMAFSSMVFVSAETTDSEQETTAVSIEEIDDGAKEYQLVWKYKEENGHLYKRRWNKTLGQWYDPAWILVY